jgi:hypothetical protein
MAAICLYHLLAERCVPDILKRAKDLKGTKLNTTCIWLQIAGTHCLLPEDHLLQRLQKAQLLH